MASDNLSTESELIATLPQNQPKSSKQDEPAELEKSEREIITKLLSMT